MDFADEVIQQEQVQQETTITDGKMMKTPSDFKDAYWLVNLHV